MGFIGKERKRKNNFVLEQNDCFKMRSHKVGQERKDKCKLRKGRGECKRCEFSAEGSQRRALQMWGYDL